jgi:hypothetical protein
MVDFAKLKANRAENTQKLVESLVKTSSSNNTDDDARFWKPTMDPKTKVGGAVIRFLPSKDDSAVGYVSWYEHSFQNLANQQWYIERSLSSIGQQDSLASLNRRLWATGIKENKAIASKQKRNQKFVTNILVVNDPIKPENNGKVFLYKFGPKIFGFIESALKPKADPITGVTPAMLDAFDMWEGANFEVRFHDTDNGWNYDACKFSTPSPVAASDALIEAVYNQVYSLEDFVDAKQYKTNEQLDKRLLTVLGTHIVGLEVIEGKGFSVDTTKAASQTQAPPSGYVAPATSVSTAAIVGTQFVSSADTSVPFDVTPSEPVFASDSDDAFFNNLMNGNG